MIGVSSMFTVWFATMQIRPVPTKPNLNGGFGGIKFTNLTRASRLNLNSFARLLFLRKSKRLKNANLSKISAAFNYNAVSFLWTDG